MVVGGMAACSVQQRLRGWVWEFSLAGSDLGHSEGGFEPFGVVAGWLEAGYGNFL